MQKLENVVLVGDSAGGSLILNICYWAIINNFPLPKGIVCIYPVFDMSK